MKTPSTPETALDEGLGRSEVAERYLDSITPTGYFGGIAGKDAHLFPLS